MTCISVIVPVYHGEKYISDMICQVEAARSCLADDDSVEIVFVNDAPDVPLPEDWDTRQISVVVINTSKNIGIHGARVKGLKKCHGEYVLFLDQDDLIKPRYFLSQLLSLEANDAVVCRAIQDGKLFYSDNCIFEHVVSKDAIVGEWNAIISPGQVLLKKESIPDLWTNNILENNGADDWFLWLCMIAEGCSFSLNQDVLYEHVLHGKNASADIVNMLQSEQEVIRIVQERKIFQDSVLLMVLRGFFKRNVMRAQELYSMKTKWNILEQWMNLKERHINFSDYLVRIGWHNVAIYGCALLGKYLYTDIKENIKVAYFVDRNTNKMQTEIPVYSMQDELPKVDGIIITLIDEAEKVEEELKCRFDGRLLILKNWIKTV